MRICRCTKSKPVVNSVTAEEERLARILPLVKKHGAAVIGMANDETGISMVPEERLALARERAMERDLGFAELLMHAAVQAFDRIATELIARGRSAATADHSEISAT